jgi:hypothetical protein
MMRLSFYASEIRSHVNDRDCKGATAEAALDAPDGMIDSMTNCGNFLVADWCPEGEMAVEQ